MAALLGDVVHAALEAILLGFKASGRKSVRDPSTVAVLKGLGGYSRLAERAIDERLGLLSENPRATERLEGLRTALLLRLPEIRQRIQEIVCRVQFLSSEVEAPDGADAKDRWPLGNGSHPEVTLQSEDLRLLGRVDLITVGADWCEILDYKTGAEDTHHHDQLRLYALLWSFDARLNPTRRLATRLVVAYASRDVLVAPPSSDELESLQVDVRARINQATSALGQRPPVAHPSADWCYLCSVRQLCAEYWASSLTGDGPALAGERFDFEGVVRARNGPRSWVLSPASDGPKLLLRTPSEVVAFDVGEVIRILSLVRTEDSESELRIGTLTQGSEVFRLAGDRA